MADDADQLNSDEIDNQQPDASPPTPPDQPDQPEAGTNKAYTPSKYEPGGDSSSYSSKSQSHSYETPQYETPQYETPKYDTPQYTTPSYEASDYEPDLVDDPVDQPTPDPLESTDPSESTETAEQPIDQGTIEAKPAEQTPTTFEEPDPAPDDPQPDPPQPRPQSNDNPESPPQESPRKNRNEPQQRRGPSHTKRAAKQGSAQIKPGVIVAIGTICLVGFAIFANCAGVFFL